MGAMAQEVNEKKTVLGAWHPHTNRCHPESLRKLMSQVLHFELQIKYVISYSAEQQSINQ
jgi:hypothetical protein